MVPGSEQDVLSRFVLAAEASHADRVVRVCADNPLIWGEAIDRLIRQFDRGGCDYCYNHIPRANRWPDGLGAEIVSRGLLDSIAEKAVEPSEREHCLNYIWDHQQDFTIRTFDPREEWLCRPEVKLDIDTADDFCKLALMPIDPGMDARRIIDVVDAVKKKSA